MSIGSSVSAVARRLPFGIGSVVAVLCVVMVVGAGAVLIGGPTDSDDTDYDFGLLRDYRSTPDVAWTLTDADLPGYAGAGQIKVTDTYHDTWLVSYPSGIGRAFMAVDRRNGRARWDQPVRAGLGDCAFTETGQVGCAIELGDPPTPAFYLVDPDGTISGSSALDGTSTVFGWASNFLRINKFGYQVSLVAPGGRTLWTQRFAQAVVRDRVQISDGVAVLPTADGSEYALRRSDGEARVSCTQCRMQLYPGGLVVQYDEAANQRVAMFGLANGRLDSAPTSVVPGVRVVSGTSTKPVLAIQGSVFASHGVYSVYDPAGHDETWQVVDEQVSKAGARPCGSLLSLARIDGSRVMFELSDGSRLGGMPPPDPRHPETNLDLLRCVGSSGDLMVVAGWGQVSAMAPDGEVRWAVALSGDGAASAVDGYVVLTQGTTLSVLRPS